ncbi:FAD:protein FMN transferase [Simiduia curdlanivorans]|nr:FAD:protein FMN transferase [Simiduia curdlanivorans]MDN3638059.1 FAD:protein FMN transferase [Simiduia curdlanivorans]
MGTEISVYLWHDDSAAGEQAAAAVMAEMRLIDQWLSPWVETSELYKVNQQAARAPVPISAPFAELIARSIHYSDLSSGAFDITFASVGFSYDYRAKVQPSDADRERLLPAINYKLLTLDRDKLSLAFAHPDIRIDLGGIAKGYAVDRAIEVLQGFGVAHATVSAGGDSRLLGNKRGKPWVVGVKNPRNEKAMALKLPLESTAISTSGDYERFFIDETTGERIHHIMNPQTGKATQGVTSVTVLGQQGFDTDPLSTTVFVLGVEKGLALIEQLPGFDAIIIDSSGKLHFSSGLMPPAQN